jgi:IS30 family transposase
LIFGIVSSAAREGSERTNGGRQEKGNTMTYHQLASEERYMISALRKQGIHPAEIARNLGRHRSTICREIQRNSARWDGHYRPSIAVERTSG